MFEGPKMVEKKKRKGERPPVLFIGKQKWPEGGPTAACGLLKWTSIDLWSFPVLPLNNQREMTSGGD